MGLAHLATACRCQELEFGCSFTFPSSISLLTFTSHWVPQTPARRIDLLSLSDNFAPTR